MCILLSTTSHPSYFLILLFNRDENLNRPTERATWHKSPTGNLILYGLDTARANSGTWLGITKTGRIAALTTLSSELCQKQSTSRGNVITNFLESEVHTDEWIYNQQSRSDSEMNRSGGICLFAGQVGGDVCITANRGDRATRWIGDVEGLSNSLYHDEWARVKTGKKLLRKMLDKWTTNLSAHNASGVSISSEATLADDVDALLADCFNVISADSTNVKDKSGMTLRKITESVFLPAFEWSDSLISEFQLVDRIQRVGKFCTTGVWKAKKNKESMSQLRNTFGGTQKQNVVLVGRDGRVTFVERTLWEDGVKVKEGEIDVRVDFDIEVDDHDRMQISNLLPECFCCID